MAVTIQVVAQARVGHFAEAQVPKARSRRARPTTDSSDSQPVDQAKITK